MHAWMPLIAMGAICLALLLPIAAWQAYVRGRSLWGWPLATLLLAGVPLLALVSSQRTVYAPTPQVAIASFWPRLGWIALFMLVSLLVCFASFSAFAYASGLPVQEALKLPFRRG